MKLWAMPCRATQDGWVMLENSDKMWSSRERNGKPLQCFCLKNSMNSRKRQKKKKNDTRGWVSQVGRCPIWYWEEQRNSFRKNEEGGPKWKQCPAVDMSGGESKVWCCKEEYYIGTCNVRFMNQGKLDVVKQEMTRFNIDIWGISELKWMGMGEFNFYDHYIYYCGQESLGRNRVALIVNKRVWNAVVGCSLKNYRMLLVCFQVKPFNAMQCKQ